MPKDFEEGFHSVTDFELTDEVRGQIVEVKRRYPRWLVAGVGVSLLTVALGGSWGYFYLSRSEESVRMERLANRQIVFSMLQDVKRVVRNPLVPTAELIKALDTALQITQTPLREGTTMPSPFIPEKTLVLVESLEALLRLALEDRLNFQNPAERATYEELFAQVGAVELEYWENGMLQTEPMLPLASAIHKLKERVDRAEFGDTLAADELRKELRDLRQKESLSVVSAAYRLGRWFRYYNKIELAEHCFDIGRRYVEGYEGAQVFYKGKRPKEINPDWNAYAGCLEALAELRFQAKQYREARSYLARMFSTPSGSVAMQESYNLVYSKPVDPNALAALRSDIGIIRDAMAHPGKLESYPEFEAKSLSTLENFAQAFRRLIEDPRAQSAREIWALLPESLRESIVHLEPASTLDEETCTALAAALNDLINDADLLKKAAFDLTRLAPGPKEALDREQRGDASESDRALVRRELLDLTLLGGPSTNFVLSDGARLTNRLGPQQISSLVGLMQELLASAETKELRQPITEKITAITSGVFVPTVADYAQAVAQREQSYSEAIALLDDQDVRDRDRLAALRQQMRQLESLDQIHMDRIREIQDEQERIAQHRRELEKQRVQLNNERQTVTKHQGTMLGEFEQRLLSLQESISAYEGEQEQYEVMKVSEPIIEQIDSQIALRNRYVTLLKELQDTDGSHRLEDLKIQRVRIQEELALLRNRLDQTKGDEREKLVAEADLLERKRHELVDEFDRLFTPIRESVRAIASKEAEIWQAEKVLKQTRDGIIHLIGSSETEGTLQEKTRQRAQLLLSIGDDKPATPGYYNELSRLNRAIAEDQAQLQMLMQREEQARTVLQIFYPHIAGNNPLIQGGELEPLQAYLQEQEALVAEYRKLWGRNELWEQIHRQEQLIRENLQEMSDTLAKADQFSEETATGLTRAMQNVLLARKRLRQTQQEVMGKQSESKDSGKGSDISSAGYMMDSVELYQMENDLGLRLDQTRDLFEARRSLVAEVRVALSEQQELMQRRDKALRARDQATVDSLLPSLADIEARVQQLTQKAATVSEDLQNVSRGYQQNLAKMQTYREKLLPKIDSMREDLVELNRKMSEGDATLDAVVTTLFQQADVVTHSLTALREDDLNNIESLISVQQQEMSRLEQLRKLKYQENYFKSKALWMIGLSCYEQSQLTSYDELSAASGISEAVELDQQRIARLVIDEYNDQQIYSEAVLGDVRDQDKNVASTQAWIANLENQALAIFGQHLPMFAGRTQTASATSTDDIEKDLDFFVARSRFHIGQIHMNRALRTIHSSTLPPQENPQAAKELDLASQAFLHYLDFAQPMHYTGSAESSVLTQELPHEAEFPKRTRKPVQMDDEARISLGVIATLKGDYLEAIRYYRTLLGEIAQEIANSSPDHAGLSAESIGSLDPLASTKSPFQSSAHPLFTSMLAARPLAHEALYRLGRNYQLLAAEKTKQLENYTPPPYDLPESLEKERDHYYQTAIAYYSQLVLTQTYSPYRRAALLQRAHLCQLTGNYDAARNDLIAVLGSPANMGGSLDLKDMTSKGDLPGELNPGYAQVGFELGKLHLNQENYVAAADAFARVQSVPEQNRFVIQAKIAYVDTLIASRKWLMADLLLKELIETGKSARAGEVAFYPVDLLIKRAEVNRSMGLMTAAREIIAEAFRAAPREMIVGDDLAIDNTYAWTLLETNFRDTIRPLADACFLTAELAHEVADFDKASRYYSYAEKFQKHVPWREDRQLRQLTHEQYMAYRDEQLLKARWGQLRVLADQVLQGTFAPYRKQFDQAREAGSFSRPELMLSAIQDALNQAGEMRPHQEEVLAQLHTFWEREQERLPEQVQLRQVQRARERARSEHSASYVRYELLKGMLKSLATKGSLKELAESVSPQSAEEKLINDFALQYASRLSLTEEDRAAMLPDNSNILNLLAIDKSGERLGGFAQAMRLWVESEMRATGLDDQFIAVSPQAGVLEEVDLYRVSLLSLVDTAANYRVLVQIADRYSAMDNARLRKPEFAWALVEIAAMTTENQQDWTKVVTYNDYLLTDERRQFFIRPGQEDLLRARLAAANARMNLGNQIMENSILVNVDLERRAMETEAQQHQDNARKMLQELAVLEGDTPAAALTRVRAKQLLNQAGA